MSFLTDRLELSGNYSSRVWNRKLCWEAKDTLFACVDRQENGNKFRCPDELYAYEMWCPTEVRRATMMKRNKERFDNALFTAQNLAELNRQKQTLD